MSLSFSVRSAPSLSLRLPSLYAQWLERKNIPAEGGEVQIEKIVTSKAAGDEGITISVEMADVPKEAADAGVSEIRITAVPAKIAQRVPFDAEKETVLTVIDISLHNTAGEEIHLEEETEPIEVSFAVIVPENRRIDGIVILHFNGAGWDSVKDYTVTPENSNRYIVSFKSTDISPFITGVASGTTITQPRPNPTLAGHVFAGWYKEAGYTTKWNFDTDTVTADTTLYAKWKQSSGGSSSSQGSSVWLTEPVQPTVQPTPTPTPGPVETPSVKPTSAPSGTPAKTPAPVMGVLAGLGAAGCVLGMRMRR